MLSEGDDWGCCKRPLPIIKYLFKHRSGLDVSSAMVEAASRGHLDIIQWLYGNANGGAGVRVAYEAAIANDHKAIVYFLARICGASTDQIDAKQAARCGRFQLLDCLIQYGSDPVHLSN